MKHILITLLLLAFSTTLFADKFVVKSFKRIDNKILLNKDKRTDANGELCAIVLVRTSLIGLGMSASTPVEGNVNWREGDYWVYLSAGTRMIKFFKKGFEALEYNFPQRIEKGKFYILELEYRRTNVTAAVNTMGFVVINSKPSGAEVLINGEATGLQTPFQNPYNEGFYRFTLKKPFYDNYSGNFTIKSGKPQHVNINLVPDYGSLKVNFTPATAVSMSIDGNLSQQNSPYFIEKLKPGRHTIILNKVTYDDYKQSFTISKGQTTTLTISMLPDFGNFVVTTNPEIHASVSIDGISYPGTTPFSQEKLLPGRHTLRLSKEMYLTYEQEFTINKGKMTTVTAKMQPNFANLTVNARPGDDIFIDRQKKGSGTYNGRLLKGVHIIEIKHANYYPESRQITIVPGHALTETFTLKPKTGTLSVMTTPIGTTVYLNGENKGQSPLFINNLIMGTYTLRLQKQGYATLQKQVNISENKTTALKETLPDAVNVQITSQPAGAKLYIDGQYKGVTPLTTPLSFATHRFKLQKEKYKDFEINKTITQATNNFKFQLISNFQIEMVFVKGGTFKMGYHNGDSDEKPVHRVTVSDFYIGKYEVTQKQWRAIMGNNPSYFKGDNLPVENVSWDDVQEFLKKLNTKTGKHYRLPTEAEWEYAARGGVKSRGYEYAGSNNIDEVAWYDGNSGNKTHPVGTKKPNELSIYDMSGNVWEWCHDWYATNYYRNSPHYNPQGPSNGDSRVLRGGSWDYDAGNCRVANRYGDYPGYSDGNDGFRVAR